MHPLNEAGEFRANEPDAEFAIADGIIRFTNRRHELTTVREVELIRSHLRRGGARYETLERFLIKRDDAHAVAFASCARSESV